MPPERPQVVTSKNKKKVVAVDLDLTDSGFVKAERLDGRSVVFNSDEWQTITEPTTAEIQGMVRAGVLTEESERLCREWIEDAEVMDA